MTREEAIKIIESNCSCSDSKLREACAMFIPELAESEDERIRKELIEFIKWSVDRHFMREDFHQAKTSEWITYLEKQKKQFESGSGLYYYDGEKLYFIGNPATEENPYDFAMNQQEKQKDQKPVGIHIDNPNIQKVDPDIKIETRTDGTGDLDGKALLYTADKSYKIGFRDGVASIKPVEIDEYKIIKKHITEGSLSSEVNKRLQECGWYVTDEKPIEWSEEDEKMMKDIDLALRKLYDASTRLRIETRLKSLRYQPQPKQEWNKEDERILKGIIDEIEANKNNAPDYDIPTYNRFLSWLKSLPLNLKKKNEDVAKLCSNEWSKEDKQWLESIIKDYEDSLTKDKDHAAVIKVKIGFLKSLHPQSKQEQQIKVGDKVSIHCRKDRNEDVISIYDGEVGKVIHVWDAKRNPWGHIGVRLDNGCNNGFYEDELEVLDEPH